MYSIVISIACEPAFPGAYWFTAQVSTDAALAESSEPFYDFVGTRMRIAVEQRGGLQEQTALEIATSYANDPFERLLNWREYNANVQTEYWVRKGEQDAARVVRGKKEKRPGEPSSGSEG